MNFYKLIRNKFFIISILLLCNLNANIEIKLNKLTASIIFTEALMDKAGRPKELKKIFLNSEFGKNEDLEQKLKKLKPIYKRLRVTKIYKHPKTKRLFSAIMIESTFTNDIDKLKEKILEYKVGINKSLVNRYFDDIKEFIPIYEKLIWKPNYEKLNDAKLQLEDLIDKLKKHKVPQKVQNFYHIKESEVRPFYVNLYPIPGGKGFKALRIENTAPVGIIINDKKLNLKWFFSAVIFHEQCHEYYAQYKQSIKRMIRKYNVKNEREFFRIFDESVQTSISAGYAFNKLTNMMSRSRWYNNKTYDALAKQIFKNVSFYLNKNRKIDENFIRNTIKEYNKI